VTPPNPSPPTNFSSTGASMPNPPNFTKNTYNDPKNWSATNPKDFPPPYFDDGAAGALGTFAANTAALASGSGATAGGTEGTYPGTANGAVPASSSVAHEGAGMENAAVLAPGNIVHTYPGGGTMNTSQTFSINSPRTTNPNADHPSSLSPAGMATVTAIAPNNIASGAGTQAITVTGTGFTRQSVIWVNGVALATTYVSSTSLTATANKKATAGTLPYYVATAGTVQTAPLNWTFT
jgi:hypothetical protein